MTKNYKGVFVCFIATLLVSYQFMSQIITEFIINDLKTVFNINFAQTGLLSSIYLYSYIILQGPCGFIAQRIGAKTSLLIAALGMSASFFIFAYTSNYYIAMFARFLFGIFAAPCVVSCFILGYQWLPNKWFPALCGLVEIMGMLGAVICPILVHIALPKYSWYGLLTIMGLIGLILFCLASVFIPKNSPKNLPNEEYHENNLQKNNSSNLSTSIITMFKAPNYLSYCFFGFAIFSILSNFGSLWFTEFAQTLHPIKNIKSINHLISILFLGVTFGIVFLMYIIRFLKAQLIMIIGSVLCFIFLYFVIYLPLSFLQFQVITFLLGFATSPYILIFSEIKKIMPANLIGFSLGLTNASLMVSGLILQPLTGYLLGNSTTASSFHKAFIPEVIIVALAVLVTIFISKQKSVL